MPTVVVAGASRGLGLEFARQYAADGWRVIATAREPRKADALRGIGADVHALDVADLAAVRRLADQLRDETVDLLVANAGVSGPRHMSAEEVDAEAWLETFRVNAVAPLALAGAFRRHVARSPMRKMAAVTSRLGSIASTDGGRYVYRSSKAALNMAWRSFALDAPDVVAILLHPGWVRTDMGGASAPVAPEESVAGMRRVIASAGQPQSSRFFNYTGEEIPW
jgi:NAD(P)-dependent dehydrogenase (short-subunit alcohol dehydrogenase family)